MSNGIFPHFLQCHLFAEFDESHWLKLKFIFLISVFLHLKCHFRKSFLFLNIFLFFLFAFHMIRLTMEGISIVVTIEFSLVNTEYRIILIFLHGSRWCDMLSVVCTMLILVWVDIFSFSKRKLNCFAVTFNHSFFAIVVRCCSCHHRISTKT